MTTLEIILTAIIWIAYGVFAAYQTEESASNVLTESYKKDNVATVSLFIIIIFSPIVFIGRAVIGIFKKYS